MNSNLDEDQNLPKESFFPTANAGDDIIIPTKKLPTDNPEENNLQSTNETQDELMNDDNMPSSDSPEEEESFSPENIEYNFNNDDDDENIGKNNDENAVNNNNEDNNGDDDNITIQDDNNQDENIERKDKIENDDDDIHINSNDVDPDEVEKDLNLPETDDAPLNISVSNAIKSQFSSTIHDKTKKGTNDTKTSDNTKNSDSKGPRTLKQSNNFLQRNNMFLTQISEERKIVKYSNHSQEDDLEPKKFFDESKKSEIRQVYNVPPLCTPQKPPIIKPKNNNNKTSPSSSSNVVSSKNSTNEKKKSGLDKYDRPDEVDPSIVPPRLQNMVHHSLKSVVYHALVGNSITDLPVGVQTRVLSEIRNYQNQCIQENLIGESSYCEWAIDAVKDGIIDSSNSREDKLEQVEKQLDKAEIQKMQREKYWKQQKEIINTEKELAINELELKFEESKVNLESEWESEKIQSRFNKPSSHLIELRQHARMLLKAHKFDDAQLLAKEIRKVENEETKNAGERMIKSYAQAIETLQKKFEADKNTLSESYDSKLNGVIIAEETDIRPIQQRIDNLSKKKSIVDLEVKKSQIEDRIAKKQKESQKKSPPSPAKCSGPLKLNSKLKLPPIKGLNLKKTPVSRP